MPLQSRLVEEVLARLQVRYGTRWSSLWQGIDHELIKADWAEQLDGMAPENIRKSLSSLPDDFPPTATAFRKLGHIRAESETMALPAPDAAGMKRIAGAIAASKPQEIPLTQRAMECLDNLRSRVKAGTASAGQRDFLKRAEAGLGISESSDMAGDFVPIPHEALPPAMREAA